MYHGTTGNIDCLNSTPIFVEKRDFANWETIHQTLQTCARSHFLTAVYMENEFADVERSRFWDRRSPVSGGFRTEFLFRCKFRLLANQEDKLLWQWDALVGTLNTCSGRQGSQVD